MSVYSDLSPGDVVILEAELEFYFKEVGYIDGNGVYQITNPNLLLEKAKSEIRMLVSFIRGILLVL